MSEATIRSRLIYWFFKELTQAQRNRLWQIQGLVPAGEEIQFEAQQRKSLEFLLDRAADLKRLSSPAI